MSRVSPMFLGKVELSGYPLLAAWLVSGGIIQLSTAWIDLKNNNMVGGNVFLFFGAFFMIAAALSVIAKFFMLSNGLEPDSYVEGWCWLGCACFLTIVTPAFFTAPKQMLALIVVTDIFLWVLTASLLWFGSIDILNSVLAYLLIIASSLAIYLAGATLCNTVYGKIIFPLSAPIIK